VKPEDTRHIEFGIKTAPFDGVRANLTYFNTEIEDYQTQVVNAQVGVLRGYLANAEKVRVHGFEFDGAAQIGSNLSIFGSVAYTEGVYVSFPDAPAPLELTGGPQAVDASGTRLPGISKWAAAAGAEYFLPRQTFLGESGDYFIGVDLSYRSSFSSNPTASQYLNVDAYTLVKPVSVSKARMDGTSSSGRAICSTRSITGSSQPHPAAPVSLSACPAIHEPLA
jgi:iron complex outermembrane receptor protein